IFQRECASCHANPTPESRAPAIENLRTRTPDAIVSALTDGAMRNQGATLSVPQRQAVAAFLASRPAGGPVVAVNATADGQCTSTAPMIDPAAGVRWNGWGPGVTNTRFQPSA